MDETISFIFVKLYIKISSLSWLGPPLGTQVCACVLLLWDCSWSLLFSDETVGVFSLEEVNGRDGQAFLDVVPGNLWRPAAL